MRDISKTDVRGKRVLVRVDLNSPVENGKIVPGPRLAAHAKTIKDLAERGARVIVLAHQGRKGKDDFLPLEQHAKVLHHLMQRDVRYEDDLIGEKAKRAIAELKDGQILVLENVRTLDCETSHDEGKVVQELAPLADYFVLDALSVAHRKHSSVVGFAKRMPSFAGNVLAEEVEAVNRLRNSHDVTFFLGGSKVGDSFGIMKKWLKDGRARKVLVGGALATLLLHAKGHKVGDSMEFLRESTTEQHLSEAKEMLEAHGDRIVLPVDVGLSIDMVRHEADVGSIHKGQIWDIGPRTVELYREAIFNSHAVVVNGPAGVYELEDYSKGTRAILEAIAQADAYSLLGGGHTVTAVEKFGLEWKHFSYISLSGKALLEYLSGKELPGIAALKENAEKFQV